MSAKVIGRKTIKGNKTRFKRFEIKAFEPRFLINNAAQKPAIKKNNGILNKCDHKAK